MTGRVGACLPSRGRNHGLIFGLIRMRSPTFICIQINAAMQVTDVNGVQRTIIPSPENRKVGRRFDHGLVTISLVWRGGRRAAGGLDRSQRFACPWNPGGRRTVIAYLLPGHDGGGLRGAPALSPGPELPGPPPTLFCPGEHCLSPGPGGSAMAGAAPPSSNVSAAVAASPNLPILPMPLSLSVAASGWRRA